MVVYGFYLLLLCHRSWMFLGVVETVVGSLLCCDMDIVQCLFSFLYYIISWLPPSAIPRNYPDLREAFHSFPSSDFLVVFSYSFALEKRFSPNVCKSGNYKGDKNKSVILKVNPMRPSTWVATGVFVVVQFYPWFQFCFPLFWGIVTYDNDFKTKGNQ